MNSPDPQATDPSVPTADTCPDPAAIEVRGLRKSFGGPPVLDRFDLTVERGRVFALLGRNGTGKTTLVRILVGLVRSDAGSARVLGLDPGRDPAGINARVGFVAEDLEFYPWMSVSDLVDFASSFHRCWDAGYVAGLLEKLGVPCKTRVSELSRGHKGKLSLVLALGHHPELLLMDEPMAGLDPVVRRQFLMETIELIVEERRTIFIVTHGIAEVEKVADSVGIVHQGRMLVAGDLESVKRRHVRLRATFEASPPPELDRLGRGVERLGNELSLVVESPATTVEEKLRSRGAVRVESSGLTLEELFCVLTAEDAPPPAA
ncbi:MAG: ABC transporter ATP-binding protein [Candidatus Riflebacteria bacterium]|nr:ABC transporter ATP-binding protein [Candidatus Riflebacteria bacterium]